MDIFEPNLDSNDAEDKKHPQSSKRNKNQSELLKATVERITYRNDENSFGIVKVKKEGAGFLDPTITVAGTIPTTFHEGVTFVARGVWQTHPKFGLQFKAYSITETLPTEKESIIRYLSSGLIKGIGPKFAERIVDHFGESTLQIMETNPDRLTEVKGLGRAKAEEIKVIWTEKKEERETILFFNNYGISHALGSRIYKVYKSRTIETVKSNPYILCQQVWGIGFLTADKIARAIGIDEKSLDRLMAGILYTLIDAESDGHTYLPRDILLAKSGSLLVIGEAELLEEALEKALLEGIVTGFEDKMFSPQIFMAERKVADCVIQRVQNTRIAKTVPSWIVKDILESGSLRNKDGTRLLLSEEQGQAVKLSAESSLLVITGGPGCGKTTVVRSIGALFKKAGFTIRLCAPTGRAAQRLQEVCDIEASTIHRLLKYDPIKKSFLHNEGDYLPFDVLIVDESSMIDIPLASSLLRAVSPETRLIFVGDKDQLPSVGPGLFFPDLLEITNIPIVTLTRLFRRSEESSINDIAHEINHGVVPNIPEPDGSGIRDAYFLPIRSSEEAGQLIERLVSEQIPKKFGIKTSDITVLSPMNQGELGIISLNRRLQSKLVPDSQGQPKVSVGQTEFRVGDRVCQRVNNYNIHEAGVFNGEQGTIYGLDTEQKAVYVKLWDGREITYLAENISQLDLAYALTIHRSQGSEVPVIILVLHDSHAIMLERQLIYTGVTRAKNLLIIVGTRSALQTATKRIKSSKRYTGFRDLVARGSGELGGEVQVE